MRCVAGELGGGALVAALLLSAGAPSRGAEADLAGVYVEDGYPLDPALGDTDRADRIAVTNVGSQRVRSFGMYLSAGADANGDGFGLFFDTISPSHEAPPGPGETSPGYGGAARLRFDAASATAAGFEAGSELFVWFPGTAPPDPADGDGAVQLVTLRFDHFDPGETVLLGIDVDGVGDFLGSGLLEPPVPTGRVVAMGQAILADQSQVYFDIVAADRVEPVPVPGLTSWPRLLLALGLLAYPLLEVLRNGRFFRFPGHDGESGDFPWKTD